MKTTVDLNCDMSEGFGSYVAGDGVDELLMPLVTSINVAAGFHAGDPTTIARTVSQAATLGLGIGVHPGYRDLVGFGRRALGATAEELVNDCVYQLGAVREFVTLAGQPLQHFKPHGALYMHAARDAEFAQALVDTLHHREPDLPILVMAGSVIEEAAQAAGHPVVREFYADRHYGDDGSIVFTRNVGVLSADAIAAKVLQACLEGTVTTVTGSVIPVQFESICIHSDTKGAYALIAATRAALDNAGIAVVSFAA